jgi:hypothetical protein
VYEATVSRDLVLQNHDLYTQSQRNEFSCSAASAPIQEHERL